MPRSKQNDTPPIELPAPPPEAQKLRESLESAWEELSAKLDLAKLDLELPEEQE